MAFEEVEGRRLSLSYDELDQLKVSFRCIVEVAGTESVKAEVTMPFLDIYEAQELDLVLEKKVCLVFSLVESDHIAASFS